MALAQLVVQVPGTLIKSGDWNNEFQNILTHPIALISPTTGAINFNLQAHTGLLPNVISATSATAGQALIDSGGATVWGTPTVTASGISVAAGSTGQVLAITSSNSPAAFQTLPIDGGLSTTVPTGGMTYSISTSAAFLKGLAIGSSGQVYMSGTSGGPIWSNLTSVSAAGGSGNSIDPTIRQIVEDFGSVLTTGGIVPASTGFQSTNNPNFTTPLGLWSVSGNSPQFAVDTNSLGIIGVASATQETALVARMPISPNSAVFFSTQKIQLDVRYQDHSTLVGQRLVGFTTGTFTTAPTNGVFLYTSNASRTVELWVISTAGSTSLSAGVTTSTFHTYRVVISSSSVDLMADGATVGSITAFNPSSGLFPLLGYAGFTNTVPSGIRLDYISILTSGRSSVG